MNGRKGGLLSLGATLALNWLQETLTMYAKLGTPLIVSWLAWKSGDAMDNFDTYLTAFDEGIRADHLTTDQNPHNESHAKMGWWHGKILAVIFEKDFTSSWMQEIVNTSAWYWKAHAQGLAAHCHGVNLMTNPYSPKSWDGFHCPEKGDRVGWNGWAAGWRYGALLNNFQTKEK